MDTSRTTPLTLCLDDTDISHDVSMISGDTSLNTSFSSRSFSQKPRGQKEGVKRNLKTYRGIESKSYNSNVRIGKKPSSVNSKVKDQLQMQNTFQLQNLVLAPDPHQPPVTDRQSVQSYQSTAYGTRTKELHWQRIVSRCTDDPKDATGGDIISDFKALNECIMCGKDDIRLKMLPCLHSYCIDCLQKQIDSATSLSSMKCFLCKRKFGVPNSGLEDLADNIYTRFSELSISENERCHTCGESVPKCRCSECKMNFCSECIKSHLDDIRDRPHYIVNVTPEMVGKTPLATECKAHKPFTLDLYCVNCSKLICGRCAIEKHNNHVAEDVQMAANDMRNNLRGMITAGSATRLTKEIAEHMHRTIEERTKLEHDTEKAINAVQLHTKQLKEEIEYFEQSTVQMIRNKESSRMSILDSKAKEAEASLRSVQLSIETMRRIIDRARDIELIERFPKLKPLALELRKSSRPSPIQCVNVSYLPLVNTLKSVIGRVNIEHSLSKPIELREIASIQVFKHISSVYPIDSSKAWVCFRKYIQLCFKDGSYGSRVDFSEPVMAIAGDSKKIIFVACKTCVKSIGRKLSPNILFQLPHEPSDMKITDNDNMVICFKEARRVVVFSQKGKLLKELDLRHLGFLLGKRINDPWKLVLNESNEVHLTDYSSETIAVFDESFEVKTAFTSNVYRHSCIACFKGLLFLSDYKRDCVHVYSEDGQLLQTCGTVGLHSPCTIAIDSVGDIWIGSWMGMVKVYTQR